MTSNTFPLYIKTILCATFVALVITLGILLCPASAQATEPNPASDFEYVILDGTEGYKEGEFIYDLNFTYYGPGAYITEYKGESTEVSVQRP